MIFPSLGRKIHPYATVATAMSSVRQVRDAVPRLSLALSFLTALAFAIALAACEADSRGTPSGHSCRHYCVSVTPKNGNTDTIFVFGGERWRPRKNIKALYGKYCEVDQFCSNVGLTTRFRTHKDGTFTFRFRNGPKPPFGVPEPWASGRGLVIFEQWRGRLYHSKLIRRAPKYLVDGRLPNAR